VDPERERERESAWCRHVGINSVKKSLNCSMIIVFLCFFKYQANQLLQFLLKILKEKCFRSNGRNKKGKINGEFWSVPAHVRRHNVALDVRIVHLVGGSLSPTLHTIQLSGNITKKEKKENQA